LLVIEEHCRSIMYKLYSVEIIYKWEIKLCLENKNIFDVSNWLEGQV
jgi:hypothetical protein